jgi:thymidylate kinase
MGIDGTGKTTWAKELLGLLKKKGKTEILSGYRGFGGLFPRSLVSRFRRKKSDVQVENEIMTTPSLPNNMIRHLTVIAYMMDYLFLAIKMHFMSADYVILDRYIYDILFVKNVSWGFKRICLSLIPDFADIVVILEAPAEVLLNRKPDDINMDEIEHQSRIFEEINGPNVHRIPSTDKKQTLQCLVDLLNL